MSESFKFSVDSHLLGEIGERLVTRNYIALSELIKNAYDADADEITVHFANAKKGTSKGKGRIIIHDDGHGMTFKEVRDYWMRIATPNKLREPVSKKYGRKKTGNKGIGRFACRRLAKELTLKAVAEVPGSKIFEETEVYFNWEDFIPGTKLEEIPCTYKTKRINNGKTGLTLELVNLNELWSNSEFDMLRRQLLSIAVIKPNKRDKYKEDNGFSIVFDAPEFPKGEGELEEQVMNAGWGKLDCTVKNDGTASLTLNAKNIGRQTYNLPEEYKRLRGMTFEIAYIPIKKEYYRDPKTLAKYGARIISQQQGGVRVFLDGFRVYPYGDPGDDWLSIDKDVARRVPTTDSILSKVAASLGVDASRAMLSHPRNWNLLGSIFISSEKNTCFEVKADREGLIENEAYLQLVKCIRLSLQWMTLYYNKFVYNFQSEELGKAESAFKKTIGKEGEIYDSQKSRFVLDKAVDVLAREAKRSVDSAPPKEKREIIKRTAAAVDFVKKHMILTETHINMLRPVASTGALMFVFAHEIKALIANLGTHADTIHRLLNNLPKSERKELEEFADSLNATRERFDQQIRLFGVLSQKTSAIRKTKVNLKKVCKEVVSGFDFLIKNYGFNEIVISVPSEFLVGPMLEAEMYSIVVNLVSNSIKANMAGNGKNIQIKAERIKGNSEISVMDDGIGIDRNFREKVFQPLTADPDGKLYQNLYRIINDDDISSLGQGSGLGLSIVRGIAETYGGYSAFEDAPKPWKTCVKVVLP